MGFFIGFIVVDWNMLLGNFEGLEYSGKFVSYVY